MGNLRFGRLHSEVSISAFWLHVRRHLHIPVRLSEYSDNSKIIGISRLDMRKIGFGLTKRIVKGNEYLYVWRYKGGTRIEKIVNQKQAMKYLRQFAEDARKDAVFYIDSSKND